MPDISVKDQIRKLVELQKLDIEIYEKKKDLIEKPAEVSQLKAQFESKKTKLNGLEEKLKLVQLKRKEQELELQEKEGLITKANASLNDIKTNKEYTAKLSEIENIKADKSIIEEHILKLYDEADAIVKDIEAERAVVVQEEKKYQELNRKVEDEVKIIEDRVKVLVGQRNQITPHVDVSILAQYERVLANKSGLAIAPVTNSSCGGCFMNLRPQNINSIKLGEDIYSCEYCSRMLYLEEDL